jgi:hypothetical protein
VIRQAVPDDPGTDDHNTFSARSTAHTTDISDGCQGSQRARLEILGAGHLAPLETPEEFRALLLGFLAGR